MVHVAVDDGDALDEPLVHEQTNREGHVIEHTEPFAMVGKGVMESTAEMNSATALDRVARRGDRAPGHQTEPFGRGRRLGNLETRRLGQRQFTVS